MATTEDFVRFVCEQLEGFGFVRSRKMFGEYMVYMNDKPIFLLCDNAVFIKMRPEIEHLMQEAERACPYKGAKEHYNLDVENRALTEAVLRIVEPLTPLPKPKKKPAKKV